MDQMALAGTLIKRLRCFLFLTLLFILPLGSSASADVLTAQHDLSYDYNHTYMLRNGDMLH